MKFSEFLNESTNTGAKFPNKEDLLAELRQKDNLDRFKALVKAMNNCYGDDDEDDAKFVNDVKSELFKIKASALANTIDTVKDIEEFENVIQDGKDLNAAADKMHYGQRRNKVVKEVINFIFK